MDPKRGVFSLNEIFCLLQLISPANAYLSREFEQNIDLLFQLDMFAPGGGWCVL